MLVMEGTHHVVQGYGRIIHLLRPPQPYQITDINSSTAPDIAHKVTNLTHEGCQVNVGMDTSYRLG